MIRWVLLLHGSKFDELQILLDKHWGKKMIRWVKLLHVSQFDELQIQVLI